MRGTATSPGPASLLYFRGIPEAAASRGRVVELPPQPSRQGSLGARRPCLNCNPLASSQMTSAWKTVACGGTRDQLFMQEKARQLLGRLKPSHTSRTLILS